MKSRSALAAVVLATLTAGTGPATAAVYDFFYGSRRVAELTAELTATGNTDFTFAFLSAPDSGAFINDLLLDMGPDNLKDKFTNTTVSDATPTYTYKAGGFEGTGMRSKISFSAPNDSNRFIAKETATWTIEGAFAGPARLHVNAFIKGDSVKLTTPVPEPEAYAMALAALGVLGVYRRLSRKET